MNGWLLLLLGCVLLFQLYTVALGSTPPSPLSRSSEPIAAPTGEEKEAEEKEFSAHSPRYCGSSVAQLSTHELLEHQVHLQYNHGNQWHPKRRLETFEGIRITPIYWTAGANPNLYPRKYHASIPHKQSMQRYSIQRKQLFSKT